MAALGKDWPIVVVAPLALALFLTGVFYGLPQQLDPDEQLFVGGAGRMLADGTLDPGWYGAPASTLMGLLAVVFAAVAAAGLATGAVGSLAELRQLYYQDVTVFYAPARAAMCLLALACLMVLYLVLRRQRVGTLWIATALAWFAVSPLVVQYAAVIRMDILQTLFNLLTIYFCVRAVSGERFVPWVVAAGACVGLAVASKYPGVIVAVAIRVGRGEARLAPAAGALLAAAAASVAAAFLSGPYLFLNFAGVLEDVAFEARDAQLGAASPGFVAAARYYLLEALPSALGAVGFAVALAGGAVIWRRREPAIAVAFFLAYLAAMASLDLVWARWAIPLVPVAVLIAACSLDRLDRRLAGARVWRVARYAVPVLVLAAPLMTTLGEATARATDRDTRVRAERWIATHLPEGAGVATESFAPGLDSRAFELFVSRNGALLPWREVSRLHRPFGYYGYLAEGWEADPGALTAAIEAAGIDYVVLSGWHAAIEAERAAYPRQAAVYRHLRARLEPICRFDPRAGGLGGRITILATDAAAGRAAAEAACL